MFQSRRLNGRPRSRTIGHMDAVTLDSGPFWHKKQCPIHHIACCNRPRTTGTTGRPCNRPSGADPHDRI